MNIGVAACGIAMLLFVVVGALFALLKGKAALRRPSVGDVAIGPAIESDDPFARARRFAGSPRASRRCVRPSASRMIVLEIRTGSSLSFLSR